MAGRIEARLRELALTLPKPTVPQANYVPIIRYGNQDSIAGQLPSIAGEVITRKLDARTEIVTGHKAARACALKLISHAKSDGDFDRVARWVNLGGFVQGTSDFTDAPQVVNGASDLMAEVFGDAGKNARFAVVVACLPFDSAAETDIVIEIR